MIASLRPGPDDSNPVQFVPFGNRLLFVASDEFGTARLVWDQQLGSPDVASLHTIGRRCDTAPTVVGRGVPRLGDTVRLELADGAPLAVGALLLSASLAPSPAIETCSLGLLAPKAGPSGA